MAFEVPVNNASTKVGISGYTAGSGSMVLILGGGAFFPSLSGNQFLKVTVIQSAFAYVPAAPTSTYTIFKVTGVSGDTLTIDSTLEGTTDRNYAYLDVVEIRTTAGTFLEIDKAIVNLNPSLITMQAAL